MASSVYTFNLTPADIAPRISGGVIDGSSTPSRAQVQTWITEVCGLVQSEADVVGVDVSQITETNHAAEYHRLRHQIAEYVAALWHASTQRDASDWSAQLAERWVALQIDIRRTPERIFGGAMGHRLRSSATNLNPLPAPTTKWHGSRGFD